MRGERGFTLMEVLVAMVLLSLFAVVAYRALDAVLNIQRQAIVKMDRLNELAAAFAIIDKDLTNATTRVDPRIPGDGGFRVQMRQDGAAQFDLMRLHPEDAENGLQRTGYRCAGETLSPPGLAGRQQPVRHSAGIHPGRRAWLLLIQIHEHRRAVAQRVASANGESAAACGRTQCHRIGRYSHQTGIRCAMIFFEIKTITQR
jgi:prepilin-type N-terminal cleavage/methylation domain-containing protein